MTDALARSLELFRDLGWADAAQTDALELPVGTEAQRREARAGLLRGDWDMWVSEGNTLSRESMVGGADHGMLALFAIRVGADARRAEAVLGGPGSVPDQLAAEVLATRGPEFAIAFTSRACRSNRRPWEHATSVHAGRAVRLVHHHELPVPEGVEYLKDWAVYAAVALGLEAELYPAGRGAIDAEVIRARFVDHLRTGVAVGAPATGPFGRVIAAGAEQGWVERDEAVTLVLAALDAAQRPGDRKAWAGILADSLALTDSELVAHADALLGALSHAEAPVVTALAPAIIEHGDEYQAADVLSLALAAKSKAARRIVLDAALRRSRPLTGEAAETAADALSPIATGRDGSLAKAAQALQDRWGIAADPIAEPESAATAWQPAPDVWSVPRFQLPVASPAVLAAAAGVLASRPEGADDLEVDRFLELANAVARTDADAAHTALRGLRPNWRTGVSAAADRIAGDRIRMLDRLVLTGDDEWRRDVVFGPVPAREASVVQRLGEVPTLLSTPSWDDLRIAPDDLVERLQRYRDAGATASEADLLLALLRLDLALVEQRHLDALAVSDVPVVLQSGELMTIAAGPAACAYALDPLLEPSLVPDEDGDWRRAATTLPASLTPFPRRIDTTGFGWGTPIELPTWGDGAYSGDGLDAGSGFAWRQLARRNAPLTPRLAARMLCGLRSPHPNAATDMFEGVLEAWDRGLLRPGVADLGLHDRGGSNGAQLARVALELSEAGLGSVVWPLLDGFVGHSLGAVRMTAGTAEIVETIGTLLPGAEDAVAAGLADPSTLDLPHTRTLAARPGSSRAVAAAKAITARLLEPSTASGSDVAAPKPSVDLDAIWPAGDGEGAAIDDGVRLASSSHLRGSKRFVPLEFSLAEASDVRYRALMSWSYALDREGQLDADTVVGDERRWLQWDEASGRIIPSEFRDRSSGKDGPSNGPVPPLTVLMVAVVLASLCSDVESRYSVDAMVVNRRFSAESVRLAASRLLPLPDISPARMMGSLERELRALPVLWPLLTESVRFAAAQPKPPSWLNRVLDVALLRAPVLRAAATAGRIPAEHAAWPGLAEIAARPGSSAALTKARSLMVELGLD
ncbi:hypothetical protein ASE14_01275 [Agromyces sp. Root81]|uniref:DUF7824 domain-containing protein n=1 Tax=Agromyces sp. Root81 TaxID=1736601 RepID=UPI0006F60E18|nr:DUF6493 family protein [Agromyces sp. Root81]KRC62496.1 hypothetical protein ASE14_01275 [Agromyces sp. Root81]